VEQICGFCLGGTLRDKRIGHDQSRLQLDQSQMAQMFWTLVASGIVGLVWLAYMHPEAYSSTIARYGRRALVTALFGAIGWGLALATVADAVTNAAGVTDAEKAAFIKIIESCKLGPHFFGITFVAIIFLEALDFFPFIGLTDHDRRKQSRDKERAPRKPPLHFH